MFESCHSENKMLDIFFNLFASLLLISVCMTVFVDNAVYAILFLVSAFFNVMNLLFLLEVDYLALLFVLIYIGAITVLFLFVVMMLKIKIDSKTSSKYIPVISIIVFLTLFINTSGENQIKCQNILIDNNIITIFTTNNLSLLNWFSIINEISNIKVIGQTMYTTYAFYFVLASIVLLIGIIGSIILSKRSNKNVRRYQLVYQQISRNIENAVFLID